MSFAFLYLLELRSIVSRVIFSVSGLEGLYKVTKRLLVKIINSSRKDKNIALQRNYEREHFLLLEVNMEKLGKTE